MAVAKSAISTLKYLYLPERPKETNTMLKSKKKMSVVVTASMILMLAGVAGFAQRHFMLANAARPEVKVQLAGSVERDSKLIALDKSTVVNPGEILDWTITSENSGNAPALEYKTVGHIPRGTRSEEHTSELQSPCNLVCRLL